MHPFIAIPFTNLDLSTSLFLYAVCVLIAPFLMYAFFRRSIPLWRQLVLVFSVSASCWYGARLFHVFFERPAYFRLHPDEIFTNFTGMTFYGGLIAGLATLFFGLRVFVPVHSRARVLDFAAVIAAVYYGILRIGCFADGCCWGKLCAYPWAVRYTNPDSAMPYLNVPVHPVQLYDSALGFVIAGFLLYLWRNFPSFKGRLMPTFLVLYAVARFATEHYRGDSFRGVHILLGLSTSQLISVGILVIALFGLVGAIRPPARLAYAT